METYDPQQVIMNVAGIDLFGFAEGSFIEVSFNEDLMTLSTGSDGRGVRTKNANRSGKAKVTLQASSTCNSSLQALVALDALNSSGVGPMLIKDGSSNVAFVHASNAWVIKPPDWTRAKEVGNVEWTFESDAIEVVHGGILP